MRVLLLGRARSGDLGLLLEQTELGLRELGVDAVHEWAEGWIPPASAPEIDVRVAEQIGWLTPGFDIVHAFGYRLGHACSLTLRRDRAWALSVLASPPTGKMPGRCPLPIAPSPRLNRQLADWCGGSAVTVTPGIRGLRPDRAALRDSLGFQDDTVCIVSVGESNLISAAAQLARSRVPNMRWLAVGSRSDSVEHFDGELIDAIAASDLLALPQDGDGFPMAALLAMHLHRPVVMREQEGGADLVEHGRTGFLFTEDDAFGSVTAAAAQMQLTLSALESAVRVKAEEEFSLERYARTLLGQYENVLRKTHRNRGHA